jgi:hypothetical protein
MNHVVSSPTDTIVVSRRTHHCALYCRAGAEIRRVQRHKCPVSNKAYGDSFLKLDIRSTSVF